MDNNGHNGTSCCALEDVLITSELRYRPAPKDFANENRALSTLAKALAESPGSIQSKLVDLVMQLCQADSAGISLLEAGPPEVFRWTAVAGEFAQNLNGTILRSSSPCGVVIERNETLLFRNSALYFPLLRATKPAICESLLAPFDVDGKPGGTVWAVKHHPEAHFNAEDARLLKSISHFAAAVHQSAETRKRAEHAREAMAELHPRLLQVSKMTAIGEIATGVANELSQPLTAIENYAHACKRMVEGSPSDLEDLSEVLDQLIVQARRAAETVWGLRRLVTTQPSEVAESDLNEAVKEVFEMLRFDARVRNVRVELSLAPQLPPVRIERTQIQHVVLNLVRNALEAVAGNPPDSREVVLETRGTADSLELCVSDNGPGLPQDVREFMGQPFFSTKSAGTGLGLSISHSIIRAHGGRLSYERNGAGGALFRIRLPL
ncbi:MAG TPA: ATP-binding protein [Steroidobacteraceae bacterium]